MPRNAQEFITFVASRFRPLEAMCRQRRRFSSDDEIVAFLRPFESDDKNLTRLVNRMREVGVLVELAGDWTPPPFLVEFIEKLSERHALASPKVIQGWIETLGNHVAVLLSQIDAAKLDFGEFDADAGRFLLHEIADVFQTIVRTVQDNCDRIAAEVADYRVLEDSKHLRSRLDRLICLHDEYLEPVIRIVDISGDFYAVTEQVSTCCARLAAFGERGANSLGDEAQSILREVIWLRRVVVRRAEEARRELAPLCEAAARESKIAKGANRALEAVRLQQWDLMNLEQQLIITEEKDGTLCSDQAIERFLRQVLHAKTRTPPRVLTTTPSSMQIPITPDDLLERLTETESIEDLLDWVLDTCEEIDVDSAMRLFHAIIELQPDRAYPAKDRLDYKHRDFIINANRWIWKGRTDGNKTASPVVGKPSRKARRGVPVT